ncbi:hypothetical protein [Pseudolactococcus reticulitermitis]|uniref:WxL domain-containing protein n=1 Tax=Pseudolactococcus reticulitermitis TaxID=2025039 RepID=A0A224WVY6_9LACT|nr:hypothetical protein [Lactococcus reticulitermitis]GAX46497.1 hypothetical protein RsY01_76 [Lactococcus reticulitermitis]
MKKLLSTLLISTAVLAGGAQAVLADQDVVAKTDADIAVSGTLGADNTDPGSTIPEGDKDWINVTLPTDVIFYNKATDAAIKSPTYDLTNNSGRPVTVSVASFKAGTSNPTLPADFALNLDVTGNNVTTASTKLVENGALNTPTNALITLANNLGHYTATDTAVADANKATFGFSGTATAATALKLNYTLSLKFDVVNF